MTAKFGWRLSHDNLRRHMSRASPAGMTRSSHPAPSEARAPPADLALLDEEVEEENIPDWALQVAGEEHQRASEPWVSSSTWMGSEVHQALNADNWRPEKFFVSYPDGAEGGDDEEEESETFTRVGGARDADQEESETFTRMATSSFEAGLEAAANWLHPPSTAEAVPRRRPTRVQVHLMPDTPRRSACHRAAQATAEPWPNANATGLALYLLESTLNLLRLATGLVALVAHHSAILILGALPGILSRQGVSAGTEKPARAQLDAAWRKPARYPPQPAFRRPSRASAAVEDAPAQ